MQETKRRLRQTLFALRESYPQIPADAKKLDTIVDRLANVALDAVSATDVSMAILFRRLQGLRINGMGQANRLWPQLFSLPLERGQAENSVSVATTSRADLSKFLRVLWSTHFAGTRGRLEWIIAAIAAWRPRSLRELHRRIERVEASFPDFDAFEKVYAPVFVFETPAATGPSEPASPDWTLLWQYEGASGYGGDYPADVKDFLGTFLCRVRDLDPRARILDIGTGSYAAILLAREVSTEFELIGIDIADIPAPPEVARIQSFKMSAESLGFPNEAFTAVMSVNGIEYADVDRAFPEMRRVMQPGARAALVLHRPDSLIVARARKFIEFLDSTLLMETLALSWLYLDGGSEAIERELVGQLLELKKRKVDKQFVRYFSRVMQGIPEAMQKLHSAPADAYALIQRFETDLRWTYERDRFLISHMSRIPTDRQDMLKWLGTYGFAVDAVQEVFLDSDHSVPPVGWAVQLRKPVATGRSQ